MTWAWVSAKDEGRINQMLVAWKGEGICKQHQTCQFVIEIKKENENTQIKKTKIIDLEGGDITEILSWAKT